MGLNSDETAPLLPSSHLEAAVSSGAVPASALEEQEGPVDDEQDHVIYSYSFL
jgi:hypothetical protein